MLDNLEVDRAAPDPAIFSKRFRSHDFWDMLKTHPLDDYFPSNGAQDDQPVWVTPRPRSILGQMMQSQVKFWEARPAMMQNAWSNGRGVSVYVKEEAAESEDAFHLADSMRQQNFGIDTNDPVVRERWQEFFKESMDVLVYVLIYAGIFTKNEGVWQDAQQYAQTAAIRVSTAMDNQISFMNRVGIQSTLELAREVIEVKNGGNHLPLFYLPIPTGTSSRATKDIFRIGREAAYRVRQVAKKTPLPTYYERGYNGRPLDQTTFQYNDRGIDGMPRRATLLANHDGNLQRFKPNLAKDEIRQVVLEEARGYLTAYINLLPRSRREQLRLQEEWLVNRDVWSGVTKRAFEKRGNLRQVELDPRRQIENAVRRFAPAYIGIVDEIIKTI